MAPHDHEYFMRLALDQARAAYEKGEFPVGCVIRQEDRVVASGSRMGTVSGNNRFSEIDHAEIRALRSLELCDIGFEPDAAIVYSTMEPCLMCLGAILIAGIRHIVYAYEDPMGGAACCDLGQLTPLYAKKEIAIVPGIMRQESLDLFYNFFNKETNSYWKDSYLATYTLDQKKH